jgi:hypothetical protein
MFLYWFYNHLNKKEMSDLKKNGLLRNKAYEKYGQVKQRYIN